MARPKCLAGGETKRDKILYAGLQAFLEDGYAAASMDSIAARAGVSKATIYSHFGSKDALFQEVVSARCDITFNNFEMPDPSDRSARQALRALGLRVAELWLSPEGMGVYRLVISEGHRNPDLARAFYEAGPRTALARVGAFLQGLKDRGLLDFPDPVQAAHVFFMLLKGRVYLLRQLGLPEDGESMEGMVDLAMDVMLRAYGPRG